MAYQLTQKLRDLTPYDPLAGKFKIRLDANESFLQPDKHMKAKMLESISKIEFNRYPDPTARTVCHAFADYYGINPALVTAGNGSDELISILANCFFAKGEKVLTVSPDFSMYRFYSMLAELDSVVMQKESDLTFCPEKLLQKAISENVVGVLLSNPCNPTSHGLEKNQVLWLAGKLSEKGILLILDEAYMDFWNQSVLPQVAEYDNLILLRTCSKAIGLAAIRLGFAVANPTLTQAMQSAKSPYNVNSMTQAVATVALEDRAYLDHCMMQIKQSREDLFVGITHLSQKYPNEIMVHKPVTNFVFVKTGHNQELFGWLLDQSVAIRYMGEYLRITAGSPDENQEVLQLLDVFFKRLGKEEKHENNSAGTQYKGNKN